MVTISLDDERVRFPSTSQVPVNAVWEHELTVTGDLADPWSDAEVDVEFTDPDGVRRVVPAFWAGGRTWRVRYSSPVAGVHPFRATVRCEQTIGIDGESGEVVVAGYSGSNPLLLHGAPTVSADRRYLQHTDGTPFLWLADTWWSALTRRFAWPETFQTLANDRAEKGFSVVQLVAGLIPEFVPFTQATESEGGQPWHDAGRGGLNPAFYNVPDVKFDYLVAKGIVPCIVGAWGFYAELIGRERLLQHWRYVVARYAAYPVVWCIGGEIDLVGTWQDFATRSQDAPVPANPRPGRASPSEAERLQQSEVFEEAADLIGRVDPFHRIRTAHPTPPGSYATSEVLRSRDSFELDMMQTGHTGRNCVPPTMEHLRLAIARGDKPVLIGECSYEGIFGSCWDDLQRFLFWSSVLSGSCGHTYGTMAISSFNSRDDPHVPLSHVSNHYWEDAIDWRGSLHVGIGKRILERYAWWQLRPSVGAIAPHANPDDWFLPYAARTDDGTLIAYIPSIGMITANEWDVFSRLALNELRPGTTFRGIFVDPRTGLEQDPFVFEATSMSHTIESGRSWNTPTGEDWVLVLQPQS